MQTGKKIITYDVRPEIFTDLDDNKIDDYFFNGIKVPLIIGAADRT